MADIQIESAAYNYLYHVAHRAGPFWFSETVGYIIEVDSANDLAYSKTDDGGATWGADVNIVAGTIIKFDCWADYQTDGDAGTKIHIAYIDKSADEVGYAYLDMDDDSTGTDQIEACQGTGTIGSDYGKDDEGCFISITKSRGGNFCVPFRYIDDDSPAVAFNGFYTSPDADTWTSKDNPWELNGDYFLVFPGNEADDEDIWGVYWDWSANAISLKTFDDSGNSWSEQAISGGMTEGTTLLNFDGAVRLSDGHLILGAWNAQDSVNADLMVWDINGAGSIVAKTNVITNEGESGVVSVFINQDNDDIYICYVSGSSLFSRVKVFYQLSQDGGANWDGETAMQADGEDDERWISAGAVKATSGGFFQPIWCNDDLNDIFCNVDNDIAIAAVGGGLFEKDVGDGAVAIAATLGLKTFIDIGGGSITPTGALSSILRFFQAVGSGAVGIAGVLSTVFKYSIAVGSGAVGIAGALGRLTKRAVGSGAITPSGALGLLTKIGVGSGATGIAGTLGRLTKIGTGAGSVGIAGILGLLIKKTVGSGATGIAGTLGRLSKINVGAGSVTIAGTLARLIKKAVGAGAVAIAGVLGTVWTGALVEIAVNAYLGIRNLGASAIKKVKEAYHNSYIKELWSLIISKNEWVSPTSFIDTDGKWSNENRAYDGDIGTYARHGPTGDSGHYLELSPATPIYCDGIRLYATEYLGPGFFSDPDVDIDVFYGGSWVNIFSGLITRLTWTEKAIPAGAKFVSKARIKFSTLGGPIGGKDGRLYEFEFNFVTREISKEASHSDIGLDTTLRTKQ